MYGQSRGAPRGLINCLNNSSLLHDLAAHPQELRRNPPEAARPQLRERMRSKAEPHGPPEGLRFRRMRRRRTHPEADFGTATCALRFRRVDKLIQGRSARTTTAKLTSKTARLVAGRFR